RRVLFRSRVGRAGGRRAARLNRSPRRCSCLLLPSTPMPGSRRGGGMGGGSCRIRHPATPAPWAPGPGRLFSGAGQDGPAHRRQGCNDPGGALMFEGQSQAEIDALIKSNPEFKQLYQRHRLLDKKCMQAELGVLPIDDMTLGQMKREKLAAKERLLRIYDRSH